MRNISIITIMLLVLTMLVGCGEDSKAAAKEAAKSVAKIPRQQPRKQQSPRANS